MSSDAEQERLSENIVRHVYLHTLFFVIASVKPHPYTGSLTTSFVMLGNTA